MLNFLRGSVNSKRFVILQKVLLAAIKRNLCEITNLVCFFFSFFNATFRSLHRPAPLVLEAVSGVGMTKTKT